MINVNFQSESPSKEQHKRAEYLRDSSFANVAFTLLPVIGGCLFLLLLFLLLFLLGKGVSSSSSSSYSSSFSSSSSSSSSSSCCCPPPSLPLRPLRIHLHLLLSFFGPRQGYVLSLLFAAILYATFSAAAAVLVALVFFVEARTVIGAFVHSTSTKH
jgi:hypothetical protein